jgi:hypothetical protein
VAGWLDLSLVHQLRANVRQNFACGLNQAYLEDFKQSKIWTVCGRLLILLAF